jgi:GDP-fucose transporter C1
MSEDLCEYKGLGSGSDEDEDNNDEKLIEDEINDGKKEEVSLIGKNKKGRCRSFFSFKVVFSVSFYFAISLLLIFVNKTILSYLPHRFNFPLTMTCTQILITFLIMLVLCPLFQLKCLTKLNKVVGLPKMELKYAKIVEVAPTCVIFVGMISLNNVCLSYVNVTLYLIFRSLTILFSVVFSYFILGLRTKLLSVFIILGVLFGYCVGVAGSLINTYFGYSDVLYGAITGMLSSVYVAMYSIFVKKTIIKFDGDHWLLMIYLNFVSFFMFVVVIMFTEMGALFEYEYFLQWDVILSLLISGVCGFLINLSFNLLIKYTSPVTKEVTALAKACLQPILGFVIFHDRLNLLTVIGAFICIFGSFLYSVRSKKIKCCCGCLRKSEKGEEEEETKEMEDF